MPVDFGSAWQAVAQRRPATARAGVKQKLRSFTAEPDLLHFPSTEVQIDSLRARQLSGKPVLNQVLEKRSDARTTRA